MKRHFESDRRTFLQTSVAGLCVSNLKAGWVFAAEPSGPGPSGAVVRLEADPQRPLINTLSWDTEGGDRVRTNLLRPHHGVGLRIRAENMFVDATDLSTTVHAGSGRTSYMIQAWGGRIRWDVAQASDSFTMKFSVAGMRAIAPGRVAVVFRFDPLVTPATVLPRDWKSDGSFLAPLIISAPDFGQMLMQVTPAEGSIGHLEGSRREHIVDLIVELPQLDADHPCTLSFTPVILDPPAGLQDNNGMWRLARRGWFNAWQPVAPWADPHDPRYGGTTPAGIFANHVLSDTTSCNMIYPADHSLFTPTLPEGIAVANLVRQDIEFWIYKRTRGNGEVSGYTDYYNFLDANANPLISAWDYVEATNDLTWLEKTIDRLEYIAGVNVRRDQDHDGLVEASQSGNAYTLIQPDRPSTSWFDATNFGHKDAYSNALIYRSWRCLADLEAKLHHNSQQAYFTQLADHLQSAYARQLLNPRTGWIAEWRSQDGLLHDHASPVINGLAVGYGLVNREQGRSIVDKLWAKMQSVGFTRYDLGIPCCLEPIPQADYRQPSRSNPRRADGYPTKPDGTDTFGMYQNGGIVAGLGAHFLIASYRVGRAEQADRVLRAMLARQQQGLFQNGTVDESPKGLEFVTWEGKPCGYEGYMGEVFFFLMAAVLREPAMQARYFRPLPIA